MDTVRVAAAAVGAVAATYLAALVVTATGVAPFGVGPLGTDPSAAAVLFVAGVAAFVCGLGLLGRRLDGLGPPRRAWYMHHVAMTPLCVWIGWFYWHKFDGWVDAASSGHSSDGLFGTVRDLLLVPTGWMPEAVLVAVCALAAAFCVAMLCMARSAGETPVEC